MGNNSRPQIIAAFANIAVNYGKIEQILELLLLKYNNETDLIE